MFCHALPCDSHTPSTSPHTHLQEHLLRQVQVVHAHVLHTHAQQRHVQPREQAVSGAVCGHGLRQGGWG